MSDHCLRNVASADIASFFPQMRVCVCVCVCARARARCVGSADIVRAFPP
jgi:hypothetical protein